ncbi:hypothetical protein TCDM_08537 [Trypanosoma cruzi Dm28c]|uniref:Uncharacterized protein n=1 Tax=Trypanosoma cruzi Dm28c TaxID=1416333 RepID=V5AS48_TRYCR|nr:hypothetical protein TCDM_08537 [Trypanosoma cruzi Dm28c]PBJ79347.1 hypothetical protein BCY84_02817 [Trypanosoma cruzi cruzi]
MYQVSTPGICQEGIVSCLSPGPQYEYGFSPSDISVQLSGEMHVDEVCPPEPTIYSKGSLSSPITEEDKSMHMQSCNMRQDSIRSAPPTGGRLSCVSGTYSMGSSQNSPLHGARSRDISLTSLLADLEGCGVLKEHYGEVAERDDGPESNGAKASDTHRNVENSYIATSRGEAERGANRYGGLTSHLEPAIWSGGRWGNMEIYMQVPDPSVIPGPGPGLPFSFTRQNVFVMGQFDLPVYADGDVFMGSRAEDKKESNSERMKEQGCQP